MNNKNYHVGRPSNEEIKVRNRNKMLKIAIPSILVLVIAFFVINKFGLTGLMGNSVTGFNYECDEGWRLDEEKNMCTQSYKNPSYLLGDLDESGVVTYEDYGNLKSVVSNKKEIDNISMASYDINRDGIVDVNDQNEFVELFGVLETAIGKSKNTSGIINIKSCSDIKKYVCPLNTNEDGVETKYELLENTNECLVTKTKKPVKIYYSYASSNDASSSNASSSNASASNASSSNASASNASSSNASASNASSSNARISTEKNYELNDNLKINILEIPNKFKVSKNEIINFNVLFTLKNDENYYYKWDVIGYNSNKKVKNIRKIKKYSSNCHKVINEYIYSSDITMNYNAIRGKITIYSDSECKQYVNAYYTDQYKMIR